MVYLDDYRFNIILDKFSQMWNGNPHNFEDETVYAFAANIIVDGYDMNMIIINSCLWDALDEDWKDMILQHEYSHCKGIADEEEADIDALTRLHPKGRELLISLWNNRHGHDYQTV